MIHGRDGLLSFGMTPGPSKTAFAGYLLGSRSSRYALVATAIETSPLTLLMLVLPRSRDQLDCLRHCTDSLARFPVQTPPLPYLIQSSFPVGRALSLRSTVLDTGVWISDIIVIVNDPDCAEHFALICLPKEPGLVSKRGCTTGPSKCKSGQITAPETQASISFDFKISILFSDFV